VPPGYENLRYIVRIKGSGTKQEFAEIHQVVMATSPNVHNVSRPVDLKPTLVRAGAGGRGGRRPAAAAPLASTMILWGPKADIG
jgi:hypothetical protein